MREEGEEEKEDSIVQLFLCGTTGIVQLQPHYWRERWREEEGGGRRGRRGERREERRERREERGGRRREEGGGRRRQ